MGEQEQKSQGRTEQGAGPSVTPPRNPQEHEVWLRLYQAELTKPALFEHEAAAKADDALEMWRRRDPNRRPEGERREERVRLPLTSSSGPEEVTVPERPSAKAREEGVKAAPSSPTSVGLAAAPGSLGDIMGSLMAELPPDAVVWRALDGGPPWTAGRMAAALRGGQHAALQYALDVLRVARDFLGRSARPDLKTAAVAGPVVLAPPPMPVPVAAPALAPDPIPATIAAVEKVDEQSQTIPVGGR